MISAIIHRLIIVLLCLFCARQVCGQDIVINELMTDNNTTIQDKDGDYSDWIEFYNRSSHTVSLLNHHLSDDIQEPDKWVFPDISIPPYGYLLVFASGKNRSDPYELHTSFKLSSDGEEVYLSNNAGGEIDHIVFEALAGDEVFERFPDGTDNWVKASTASPEGPNRKNNQLLISTPEAFHASPFFVSIASLQGDTVYYTLDGSIPRASSNILPDSLFLDYNDNRPNYYSDIPATPDQSLISYKAWEAPDVMIDKAHILRYASYRGGSRTSKIYTQTFFIDKNSFSKYDLPIISLVSESENFFNFDSGIYVPGAHYNPDDPQWTGNYFQEGTDWERPVHIEYFETDGDPGFSQDAGIRIHGLKTRQAAQKSLRLYARNEYGDKYFNYQPFHVCCLRPP